MYGTCGTHGNNCLTDTLSAVAHMNSEMQPPETFVSRYGVATIVGFFASRFCTYIMRTLGKQIEYEMLKEARHGRCGQTHASSRY